MEQSEFTEKNAEQKSSNTKNTESAISSNMCEETSKMGNVEASNNSTNLPSNVVKDSDKSENDERNRPSSGMSYGRHNKRDFKETAKYRDSESYGNQHHHSIGEGLYMTDEINDLPPRFRTKVMAAFQNVLALHNIQIDRNPLDYFVSYNDDSKESDKNRDKLVYLPPSILEDEKRSREREINSISSLKGNSVKSHECLNSNSSLNTLANEKSSFSGANLCSQNPSQSVRNKTDIKFGLHPSRTHSDNFNSFKNHSSLSNKNKPSPNSNYNDSKNYKRISVEELFPAVKSNSLTTLVSNNIVNDSCSAATSYRDIASNLELNKKSDSNFCNDFEVNANTRTHNKRNFDSKMPYKYSDRRNTYFNPNKSSFTKSHYEHSSPNFPSVYENQPQTGFSKSTMSSANYADSSTAMKTHTNYRSNHFQSDKTKNLKYNNNDSEPFNAYQNASKSQSNSERDSLSFQAPPLKNSASDTDKNDGKSKYLKPNAKPPYAKKYDKEKLLSKTYSSKVLDVPPDKESNMMQDLSLKDTFVQNRCRKYSDSHSSISSSHSSKSYDNVPRHNSGMTFHDNSINAVHSVNNFHNSPASFSHKKPRHQQIDRENNIRNSSKNYANHKDNYSDSSSVFSDKSARTRNSCDTISSDCDQSEKSFSDRLSSQTNRNSFMRSSDRHFGKRGGTKNYQHPKPFLKNQEILDRKQNLSSTAEKHYNYNRADSNSSKSNYAEKCYESASKEYEKQNEYRVCTERGFFIKVEVSEKVTDLEYWIKYLKKIFSFHFELERCCHFSDVFILEFDRKEDAIRGIEILHKKKKILQKLKEPHFLNISTLLFRLIKPCNCRETVIRDTENSIKTHFESSLCYVNCKVEDIVQSKFTSKKQNIRDVQSAKRKILKLFEKCKSSFTDFRTQTVDSVMNAENLRTIQQLKHSFLRECTTFKRCLPIYSQKKEILDLVRFRSVSVIVAETGSGKSTQLVEYLLHSSISENGLIICTQPRKLAAITIAQFVSGQIGSAIGKIVGYDVGIEKKWCKDVTKIVYMTDYCLLQYFLRNRTLKGVSCVIIDEAHERSLYTDLILGLLKECLNVRRDLSVLITSATINPTIFVNYFDMPDECVIDVPGRAFPVDVVWYPNDVEIGWDYLDACVRQTYEIFINHKEGDILVFLTSPSESEEAINLFKHLSRNKNKNVQLLSLHGKSDIAEQMLIFQKTFKRKIIFATNVAETAVTIPGIKYVVDSGMSKELMFDPQKNKSYLAVTFTTKSAAEQRKGRAGRIQSGICYRMYSERNYEENMTDNAVPEIFKSNLQKVLLKIFEFGIDPEKFDFIESPPATTISNSVEFLELLGAVKNKKLTDFGKKLVKLPLEPQLSKLILLGIAAKIGIEAIIIAALVSESGKLFIRFEDNRAIADEKKKKFCHQGGDLCTYLEIYKRWKEIDIPQRYDWCITNYLSFKTLNTARKTVKEILITLRTELGLHVSSRFNNDEFKKQYEKIIFDSFSENLCVLSGHPKLGYFSPYLSESFFIHPSSTLSCLGKDSPEFLVYSTLMETSRNFLFDVTPISESTLKSVYQAGKCLLPVHTLRCLQVPPKRMGPFGESVIVRHILGKGGSKIRDLEKAIMDLTRVKNLYIDVDVAKGLITIHISHKLHEKVEKHVQEIINVALTEMLKEEDVAKLSGTCMYFALGAGGLINDIIMPGEFRELTFNKAQSKDLNELEKILQMYGPLQSFSHVSNKREIQIYATFKKVCDAKKAFLDLKERKKYNISPKPYLPDVNNKPLQMLLISWCCCPCTGYGLVEFVSQDELIEASGSLTSNSFFVGNNLIMFQVHQDDRSLIMKNLPEFVEEQTIREKLKENLPHINVKSITIHRKSVKITEASVEEAKKKLSKLLSLYVSSSKFTIDLKYPKREASWNATVYFESAADAERTYIKLKDNTCIDSYPVYVRNICKIKFHCSQDVYRKFSAEIHEKLRQNEAEGNCSEFLIKLQKETFSAVIEINCISLDNLNKTKLSLEHFVEGEYRELMGRPKYHFLFTDCVAEQIKNIQRLTNTLIKFDKIKKVILVYGSTQNCKQALKKIYDFSHTTDCSFTRTFKLKDSCIPYGFLKNLYSKYGYNLLGLVKNFNLAIASVDNYGATLTLKGKKEHIKQAEQALEKMCQELFEIKGSRQKTSNDEEICAICFDPVSYDFQRLEHCGHAFCRQCLLLQLESKTLPVVCVKQECGKLVFLEDIKRIVSIGDSNLKKAFCAVAVQYHVSCNIGKLSYCRTPDCQMIYRVTKEGSEYICPNCDNSICTRCHSAYHYGMTCEMFQECEKDVDFSLTSWVKEKETSRKYCPSCDAVIEKVDGCNHMECLNCKAHMCWLCLKIFKTGDEVYSHLPYCPKNQAS